MRQVYDEVKTEGNFEGTKIYATLDVESQPQLMAMFTDLYTDRIKATAREYMANALDAHRAAGVSRPIEVFTPTPLESVFKVKDWGPGLDKQDIIDVISKYGASTKRDTDDQDGCLGLGCKSALTYSPQFTYIGIKNGIKTVVLVSRDEDNRVSMTVMDPMETDEPSGVEVAVPVRPGDVEAFENSCREYMKYFPEDSALLNGKPVEPVKRDQVINDNLFLHDHTDEVTRNYRYGYDAFSTCVVVMGNIAYPVSTSMVSNSMGEKRWRIPQYHTLVAYVPMGSVHFQPSREGLRDTSRTMATLKEVMQTYEDNIVASMERDINKCETHAEAMKMAFEFKRKFVGFPMPKYKGEVIPEIYEYTGKKLSVNKMHYYLTEYNPSAPSEEYHYRGYAYNRNKKEDDDKTRTGNWEYACGGFFVDGFDIEKWTRRHLHKMLALIEERGLIDKEDEAQWAEFRQNPFVIFEDMPKEFKKWINTDRVLDFSDIREYKLPVESSGENKRDPYAGSYEHARGHLVLGTELIEMEKNGQLYHVETEKRRYMSEYNTHIKENGQQIYYYQDLMNVLHPGCTVLCIPGNRMKKFERTYPNSKPMLPYVKAEFEKIKKGVGKRVAGYRCIIGKDSARTIAALLPRKLHDPELRAVSLLLNDEQVSKKVAELNNKINTFSNVNMILEVDEPGIRERYDKVVKRYPLLNSLTRVYPNTTEAEHVTKYVNVVFDGRKE